MEENNENLNNDDAISENNGSDESASSRLIDNEAEPATGEDIIEQSIENADVENVFKIAAEDTLSPKENIFEDAIDNTDNSFQDTMEQMEEESTSDVDIDNPPNNSSDKYSSKDNLITVRPVKFQQFDEAVSNLVIKKNLDIMQDIPMHITVELGRTKSSIKEIVNMEKGSIVELDKIAGEQVEIFVNEKLVARGEVIVIEDKFGVRVVNTGIPKEIV